MASIPFFILDVFAQKPYHGNQLCVFAESQGLTDERMLAMAREINFAETTFITGGSAESGFEVRIFTPEYEVPFAGHPTLGTAYVVGDHVSPGLHPLITLNLPIGPIPTRFADGSVWLQAAQPLFGPTFDDNSLMELLGLSGSDIAEDQPIQVISTGLPYLIIPVRSLAALRSIRLDAGACRTWLIDHQLHKSNSADGLTTAFYPFCRETYSPGGDLAARMLCLENNALVEDAATGSAGSCLLAYLLKNRPLGASLHLQVEQGYAINRPSLIRLEGQINPDHTYALNVGGQVQLIAKGEWML